MATYVKGDAVPNATSYELYEKVGTAYNLKATASEINFNLDNLNFEKGNHVLVVKAKADGYEDSDYSNEVTFNTHNINYTLNNCTGSSTNPTTIDEGESITLSFTPDTGYALPDTVTVSGASYTWNKDNGELVISNATSDVSIEIICVVEEIITQEGNILIIENANATQQGREVIL